MKSQVQNPSEHTRQASKSAAQKSSDAAAVESPQGDQLAQLEATAESSPQQTAQRKLAEGISNGPYATAQRQKLDGLFGEVTQRVEEEEPLQGKLDTQASVQLKDEAASKPNNTGLPDNLKAGVESLSGISMDNVKVHYNSSQPAQLNAFAYAQGEDIHVGPGQERHLPHEAWHVVQQAQGRVKPTVQMKKGTENDTQEGEVSPEAKELLELSDELQQHKSEIKSASGSEINQAITLIRQAVQFGDESTISEGLKSIKSVAAEAEAEQSESGTAQLASWAFKGALIGGILGTIVPVIGNILGGIIGYFVGKQKDLDQLYADGATPVEVAAMMAIEPSAYTIHTQIQAEATQSPTRIAQLYADGATSAEVTALLAAEPNAQTLHAQIQTEAAQSPTRIAQLYTHAITSAEITALLAVEPNALTIHHNLTTTVLAFILGNIPFASVDSGNVGSIYFHGGRVRLTHPSQPAVEPAPMGYIRSTLDDADLNQCWNYWDYGVKKGLRSVAQFHNYVQTRPSYQVAAAGVGGTLVELLPGGWHPSRGTPMAFNYVAVQSHLNVIANAASLRNNASLRAWMGAIQALSVIPMN